MPDKILTAEQIEQQRALVVKEAITWEWTPFKWKWCLKGRRGGVDCGTLIAAVFRNVGLVIDLPRYTTQFFLHRDEEVYLEELRKYCIEIEIDDSKPGDIMAYQMGRAFGHGAIVIQGDTVIHADSRAGFVRRVHSKSEPTLNFRRCKAFSLRQWHPL